MLMFRLCQSNKISAQTMVKDKIFIRDGSVICSAAEVVCIEVYLETNTT